MATSSFNITEVLFIIGSILLGVFGILHFFNNKQYTALVVYVPLLVWVLVIFGLRWFGPNGEFKNTTVKWPPYVNTCPDFLVEYNRKDSNNKTVKACIDPTGVSKNGIPKVFPEGGSPTSDAEYFFELNSTETRAALCTRLKTAGLTWEGIYDGQTCFSSDGSGAGGGNTEGTGGNNCAS